MANTDRRVQRTRELLQQALIELIRKRGYDAITIQDIVDHANVGRTTSTCTITAKMSCSLAATKSSSANLSSDHSTPSPEKSCWRLQHRRA